MGRKLTHKQRRFVEAYMGEACGNATEAARLAGYASPEGSAADLMGNPKILAEIAATAAEDPLIATREDRQRWWTEVMLDESVSMKDRIKASELLGKSQADFVQRHELTATVGATVTAYVPSNGRKIDE